MNYQKKVKAISTKWLTNNLKNEFSILNGAKGFSSEMFQNFFVFIPAKNTLNFLVGLFGLICGNLMGFQKKILKI